jgi:hypothetical protein
MQQLLLQILFLHIVSHGKQLLVAGAADLPSPSCTCLYLLG